MQEGWHYELINPQALSDIKGVVYSEMMGAYSSPDTLLSDYSMRSLFLIMLTCLIPVVTRKIFLISPLKNSGNSINSITSL
jgi:hypothetical protein